MNHRYRRAFFVGPPVLDNHYSFATPSKELCEMSSFNAYQANEPNTG